MRSIASALLLTAIAIPALADTITLTPAQIEAAKEAGAAQNAHAASLGQEPVRDRAVHGEVGVSIGTGGYSSIYGTAVAPLGDSGVVAISVAQERYGRGYYRRR